MVHIREVDGQVLEFGHSGWLWFNAYLLYDRGTDSLWHHQTGTAMSGPLRGRRMRSLPSVVMSYRAWRAEHPGTLVLAKPLDPAAPVEEDAYARRNSTLRVGLHLELPGGPHLYPFVLLRGRGLVQEEVGGTPAALLLHEPSRAALAYDRRIGTQTLELLLEDGPRPRLRERGGPRSWWALSGDPVPGTGAEEPLARLRSTPWEVNAWLLQHPGGVLHERLR